MFICISHGDNQSFLVNTDCPVLLLLSHLRSKVGVPTTDVIDLCDKLGTPKLLFQVKTLRERASEFLPAPGTYYVCRVDLGTPGTAQEQASRTFTPLLKDPSAALTEALRQHGQHPHRRLQRSLKAAEGRRTPTTEALPAGTQAQGASMEHPRGSRCQRLPGQVVKMSGSEPERPQFLFVKALASRGRLEAVTQQMGYHPRYLDSFLKTQHYLLHMDGPLPFDCRHYIAIMAAARHHCRYLVNLHVLQFLRAGGDPQWLRGLDFIPPKLRNLNEINKILAHRPWLITKEHIEKLLKISEWSWSLAELVHAVVLLAHCHALASFVFGCGCEQEEGPGGRGSLKPSPPGNQCFCEAATGNGCSQELLRINRKRSLDSCMELDSLRERIQRIHVETEGREETRLLPPDREEDTDGEVTGAANLACYMQDPDFGYQDFARRDEDQTQVFRVQDYSWEDHGFSLVNRLYSDIGHLLDEKFRMVGGLQSSAMAKRQGCEPSVFKRGIWNYIHCMFGIRYDDYDYAEVNHLLERMLKVYIKTVTCYPEKTNPEMFDRFWKQFKHSEKVHVNLLILEARMQAELLYALQAITQYMVS
uniref:Sestrin 3 n=1 Tax=Anser cygnoides TaxID=8845 RepID=A0A8B9D5I4_ANSCY